MGMLGDGGDNLGDKAAFGKVRVDCSCDVEAPSRLHHSLQPHTPTVQRCDRIALHASHRSCLSLANPSTLPGCVSGAHTLGVCVCVRASVHTGGCMGKAAACISECVSIVMNVTVTVAACERKMISRCCEMGAQRRRLLNTHFIRASFLVLTKY